MKSKWLKGLALLGEWPTCSKSQSKITIKGTHPQGTEVFINGKRVGLPIVRVHVDVDARQPKMNTVFIEAHVDEVEMIGAAVEHVAIPLQRPASEGDKGV